MNLQKSLNQPQKNQPGIHSIVKIVRSKVALTVAHRIEGLTNHRTFIVT